MRAGWENDCRFAVLCVFGLVSIAAGDDKRERVVSLTEQGRAAIDRATPVWHEAQDALTARFGEDRWRRMIEDMNDLGALIEEDESAEAV